MKHLIFMTLLSFPFIAWGQYSDSTLDSACKQTGFSCGECETDLQNDLNSLLGKITGGAFKQGDHWGTGKEKNPDASNIPMANGVTLDNTLQDIIGLFKKHNPVGDNKLNFVVIGESESAQGTSVKNGKMNPRIMLKSPNSELIVTFNTDPEAKGYNTLEIMRWNGRQGRYEFQELNFGEKGAKPHVDASGTKCMECHKESSRPNWDTYRAWAGVVPSRDDMMEMHSTRYGFDKTKGMQPDARAYLSFLEQVASDKDSGKKSRLAMLDIPFDEKNQLRDYVAAAGGKALTSTEKIDIIKQKINRDGFYRVKHFPDKDEARGRNSKMSFNFDTKTANWAGPSQFAFDQMLAQNMCKVATDLRNHKDFNKFKHGIALIMRCGRDGSMSQIYPDDFKQKIVNYYNQNKFADLLDIDPKLKPKKAGGFAEVQEAIMKDTEQSHKNADGYKFNRHGRFLASYLTGVEGMNAPDAKEQANYYSKEVLSPTQYGFHAIEDQGGVKGVGENSGGTISELRMLLEPFGVKVGHWSLVHGKSNAYNSFSFSDQFPLFKNQPLWDEILDEAGSCGELENKARAALMSPSMTVASAQEPEEDVDNCAPSILNPAEYMKDKLNIVTNAAIRTISPSMKKSLDRCLSCHDKDGDVEFPGLRNYVKGNEEKEFVTFLNSQSDFYKRPMVEVFMIKLGAKAKPQDGLEYGDDMPPSDWKDNAQFAAQFGMKGNIQEKRRKDLGLFLNLVAGQDKKMQEACEKINSGDYVKDFNKRSRKTDPSKASKQ